MNFNPSKYRISETAEFEVPDANGEIILIDDGVDEHGKPKTKPWTITVASPGTKKAMRALHQMQQSKVGDLTAQMKGQASKRDEMDDTKDRAKFLLAITEGTNVEALEYDGKTGLDALHAIYMDPFMGHVAQGLEKFFSDRGNFYKG